MALTNVWWRSPSGEWVRTTAKEADREYDYTDSANSAHFRCYKCFQYVAFIKGKSNISHFKHSRGEQDKDCEDRISSMASSRTASQYDAPMPLKLLVDGTRIYFQIGFLPVNESDLSRAISAHLCVIIKRESDLPMVYTVDSSRFIPHTTTWIDLSEGWTQAYTVQFNPSQVAPALWKRQTNNISDDGALFDYTSGYKVPGCSDVVVGKDYYFLLPRNTTFWYACRDVYVEQVKVKSLFYDVYRIRALRYSEQASDFFFDFMKMRLTQHPAEIDILWPPVISEENVVMTNMPFLWVLSRGEADLQTYPKSGFYINTQERIGAVYLSELKNTSMLQMVCAERYSRTITCLYVSPIVDALTVDTPNIEVSTDDGVIIQENILDKVPDHGIILIKSEVAGSAEIYNRHGLCYRKPIRASKDDDVFDRISDIKFGDTIIIRQGLDIVRKIIIGQIVDRTNNKNDLMPWTMRSIPFPRRYAGILEKLEPKTELYQRCLKALHMGKIPMDGLAVLQKVLEDLNND